MKAKDVHYQVSENDLDIWGWTLVNQEHFKEALEVFNYNCTVYPKSPNACDSYGGELEALGHKEEAVKWFKKALVLNPADGYAMGHLRFLGELK